MAYPYDEYGEVSEETHLVFMEHLDSLRDDYNNAIALREAFFDWARQEYPAIEDRDLWDEWRDWYKGEA